MSYKEDGIILEDNEFKRIDTIILATGFKVNFDIFERSGPFWFVSGSF